MYSIKHQKQLIAQTKKLSAEREALTAERNAIWDASNIDAPITTREQEINKRIDHIYVIQSANASTLAQMLEHHLK